MVQSSTFDPVLNHRSAFVFPGQGSQFVGMGKDLAEWSASVRHLFEEVDEALGTSLSSLMFTGPQETLTRTINAQPAVMVVSLACLMVAKELIGEEQLPRATYAAGHSLGEYTAMVAGGGLSISDGVRLVRERGRLMQEASERKEGGMAAVIGLDEITLESVCLETGTQISNVNAADQIVIAGERVALARAVDLAIARGAKRALTLRVGGAFHTALMKPASDAIAEIIRGTPFTTPNISVIANCTGQPLTSIEEIKQELIDQLCSCVQWKQSVSYMVDHGTSSFYEIGPGRILSNLIRHAHPDATTVCFNNLKNIQEFAS